MDIGVVVLLVQKLMLFHSYDHILAADTGVNIHRVGLFIFRLSILVSLISQVG